MTENKTATPLSKVLLLPDGITLNKSFIDIIIADEIPVLCINRNTKKERLMPFKVLFDNNNSFWENDKSWNYYITGEDLEKIREKSEVKTEIRDFEKPQTIDTGGGENLEELRPEAGFGSEYDKFVIMSKEEKLEHFNKNKLRLNELAVDKNKDSNVVTETLVDSVKDAALINHAVLSEAMQLADDEAIKFTNEFVDVTHEMVKFSTQLVAENVFNDKLMETLVKKSNGTIVQHMTRVFLSGISFISYYNNLVSTSSAIQKLRISFAEKYRNYYHSLFPHIHKDDIILERIFYGGMRAVSPEMLNKWALGFLVHDIGKASAIEYHEGEAKYDRNTVIEHVKIGYKSIMSKTNYPMEASLITGYHHEYYGNSEGYGYFRAYLQQYRKQNPDAKQDYCITYELEPILDYQALAYFPAKVLEIIDVYDSVTDPHRVYRKAMTPEEALAMMREQFIEKHLKIDPILFDIFTLYIREKEAGKR